MQRASQLASGKGIGYNHWPASQVFRKGVKITPGSDFVEMYVQPWSLPHHASLKR